MQPIKELTDKYPEAKKVFQEMSLEELIKEDPYIIDLITDKRVLFQLFKIKIEAEGNKITYGRIGKNVQHLNLPELIDFYKRCSRSKNFTKCFLGATKV